MNMGPVRGRSRPSGEPSQIDKRGDLAAHETMSEPNGLPGSMQRRLAELADGALRSNPDCDTSPALRETRLNEVRDKIANGYYSRPDTMRAIATKLFDSLDL